MNWRIKEPDMEIKGNISIKTAIKNVIEPYKDWNFRNYLVSYFLLFVIITIFQMLILNYNTFVLGLRGNDFFIFAVIAFISATISFFFFQWLSKRWSLKRSMKICLIMGAIAFLSNVIFFFPVPEFLIMPVGLIIAAFCLATFIGALIYPMAIVSNIIDLANERTGRNLSGSYMGSMTMITSLASACGVFIISIFLELLGSEKNISFLALFLLAGFLNLISYYFFKRVKTHK
jgi:Na+/melibiose symporter-like transporter